ncbi:MAG: Nudix family hydrolase [Xanthomonadales bacterium]|nr:Nudix family hydrolase [Xanthomonadales bacterium]MDL1869166.1 Nudix family hydrolase [Gammaproteobacteria bacterium PRO6]
MANAVAPLHVVAGVIHDAQARVLLAQRPPGRHLAGQWEFPGGKCDAGEAAVDALARELREELGITVESARPLIRVPHAYAEHAIVLDVWQVTAWSGRPAPREGQRLAWVDPAELARVPMPAADRPVIGALRLPARCLVTPAHAPEQAADVLAGIERACRRGVGMIRLHQPHWPLPQLAALARQALASCRERQVLLLLDDDARLAAVLGLDGAHLAAAATGAQRALPPGRWFGVACHDADDLAHAVAIGADFATLAPLYESPAWPQRPALGWERFEELVAEVPIPVYACGGLEADDLDAAQMAGAQGIAASRALW